MQTQTPDMSKAIKVAAWLKTTLKDGYLAQNKAVEIALSKLEDNVQRDFFYAALLEDEVTYGIAAKNLAAGYVARNGKDIAEIAKLRQQLADLESKLEPLPPYLEVSDGEVGVREFSKYKVAGLRNGPKTAKLDGDAKRGESPSGVYRNCRFLYYCKLGRDRQVYGTLKATSDGDWVIAITDRAGVAVSHKSDTARKAVLEGWLAYATRLVALGKADPTTIPLVQQWDGDKAIGHTNPAVPRDVFGVDDGSLKEGADFRYLDDNE